MVTRSRDVLRRLIPPVPPEVVARARAWSPDAVPVDPAPSASVAVLRDGPDGIETYLLHRHARMSFAASMVVFPGGRVEPVDETAPDPLRACAVRETEEEIAVRLAPESLQPWAHWTTPAMEPRRFATAFFVAELPAGQEPQDISGETDTARWWRPQDALAAASRGEISLMPPTCSILTELAEAGTTSAVLAAAAGRVIEPVLPVLVQDAEGWRFEYFSDAPSTPGPG
jgi:8-oxo-dGTP pyrophosphatase MutT (NUDIX family)